MAGSTRGSTARSIESSRVLRNALVYGACLAGVIAIVGASIGAIVDGERGVVSAFVGTAMALVFMGLTAGSILVVNRFSGTPFFGAVFFGVVMGTWLLKLVLFLVLVVVLRGAAWVNPLVLFFCIVAGIVGSLVVDVIVVSRSRVPYVDEKN